jgi:hypothetical protein
MKCAKNGSLHKTRGAIREGWLMVFYRPFFTLSPYLRSFSAVCSIVPIKQITKIGFSRCANPTGLNKYDQGLNPSVFGSSYGTTEVVP